MQYHVLTLARWRCFAPTLGIILVSDCDIFSWAATLHVIMFFCFFCPIRPTYELMFFLFFLSYSIHIWTQKYTNRLTNQTKLKSILMDLIWLKVTFWKILRYNAKLWFSSLLFLVLVGTSGAVVFSLVWK